MIDPRHLTLVQWVDAVTLTLATAAPIPKLLNDAWKEWAITVVSIPQVAVFSPPDPRLDADWRTWAQRFVECVPL